MPNPGDIVIVDFPGAQGVKRRPAVVVSSATYHAERPDVIVAALTTNIAAATASTDYVLQDWGQAGLNAPTAFRSYLVTFDQRDILRVVGALSGTDWTEAQVCLKIALSV